LGLKPGDGVKSVAGDPSDGEGVSDGGEDGGLLEVPLAVVEEDVGGGGLVGECALIDVDEVWEAVAVDIRGVDGGGPVAGGDDGGLGEEGGGLELGMGGKDEQEGSGKRGEQEGEEALRLDRHGKSGWEWT
jgi:hypothetical protein